MCPHSHADRCLLPLLSALEQGKLAHTGETRVRTIALLVARGWMSYVVVEVEGVGYGYLLTNSGEPVAYVTRAGARELALWRRLRIAH